MALEHNSGDERRFDEVDDDGTWIGAEEVARKPVGRRSDYELRDYDFKVKKQQHENQMQMIVTVSVVGMIVLTLGMTILAAANSAISEAFAQEILRTVIGPLVVGGLIAIVSCLFRGPR